MLIARLTAQLRCYVPEPVDETWGRLRHLGARREQLIIEIPARSNRCATCSNASGRRRWNCAQQPFRSHTWLAALTVIADRDGGDLERTRRLGPARFEHAVRREIIRQGRQKPCMRIVSKLFAAFADPAGVSAHRAGALERVPLLLQDWTQPTAQLTDTETRMTGVLDELELTGLVTSITGISPVGAAAILAETGDPHRFATARALVKHAGLAPREKLSGAFVGRTKLTGQGRPALRLAAWRAVWGAQRANPVYAARYAHLTTRETTTRPDPSPDRDRRRDPAPPARRDHHRPDLGPDPRHPRHPQRKADTGSPPDRSSRRIKADGRGEPYSA